MNKEYYNNQKEQRKTFKKYRKHMLKLLASAVIGVAASFAFPGAPLFAFLKSFLSEYVAGSIVVWSQILTMAGCGIGTIYHTFKAAREKQKMDELQGEEENMVDCLTNENDELKKKVDDKDKELAKTKEETKTESRSYDNKEKNNNSYVREEEKQKTKRLTR